MGRTSSDKGVGSTGSGRSTLNRGNLVGGSQGSLGGFNGSVLGSFAGGCLDRGSLDRGLGTSSGGWVLSGRCRAAVESNGANTNTARSLTSSGGVCLTCGRVNNGDVLSTTTLRVVDDGAST